MILRSSGPVILDLVILFLFQGRGARQKLPAACRSLGTLRGPPKSLATVHDDDGRVHEHVNRVHGQRCLESRLAAARAWVSIEIVDQMLILPKGFLDLGAHAFCSALKF